MASRRSHRWARRNSPASLASVRKRSPDSRMRLSGPFVRALWVIAPQRLHHVHLRDRHSFSTRASVLQFNEPRAHFRAMRWPRRLEILILFLYQFQGSILSVLDSKKGGNYNNSFTSKEVPDVIKFALELERYGVFLNLKVGTNQ
ncbi:hypothetical protein H4582DRAFT_1880623 [Lactarius indigo]|nr:hypothetical protein H4582DRAFT_1880623 [Lactarius indigo]